MTAPIRRRTQAREIAMQVLFQFDLRGPDYAGELGQSVRELCRAEFAADAHGGDEKPGGKEGGQEGRRERGGRVAEQEVVDFATALVEGTLAHRERIDGRLTAVTRNWDLRRMAAIDRNVMRMAVYELMHCRDIPPKVVINEAIEIGKKFSTANSGGFVNGILDRIRIDLETERQRDGDASGQTGG